MGMYDYVDIEIPCPVCGDPVKDFQTKDGPRMLYTLTPGEECIDNPKLKYIDAYTSCPHRLARPPKGREEPHGLHSVTVTEEIWISIKIPVEDNGLLCADREKWKIAHEKQTTPNTGQFQTLDFSKEFTEEYIKKFNQERMKQEREKQ